MDEHVNNRNKYGRQMENETLSYVRGLGKSVAESDED